MRLVADIGGTHARFALLDSSGNPTQINNLKTGDHLDLTAAVKAYLAAVAASPVQAAVISIAAPLGGDRVCMTNAAWDFSIQQTQVDLGLENLRVINDFEALALAVPTLLSSDLTAIGHNLALDTALCKAVIGPGTGLGMAGVMPTAHLGPDHWQAIACEGGHASFAPTTELDHALLKAAWDLGLTHVCWEDFLSGTGLPLLYQCICHTHGYSYAPRLPAEITNGALKDKDEACLATLLTFCGLLGSAAGDLALMTGARGGLYVKGGVLDRVLEVDPQFLAASQFRQRFCAKGAYSAYMHRIPTWFITAQQLALRGCAAAF
jgi:glucokinase